MSQEDPNNGNLKQPIEATDEQLGLAGRTARFFINSPLAPLFFVSMMLMGLLGLVMTPRQEDPQISVPMVDIFVQYSGASADQVSNLAIEPLERIMSEIDGIKHVYSVAQRGMGMVTIEFDVGEEMGPSLVKVNDKLDSNMDMIPPGVSPPLVKAKGIDDVPVVNITLWSRDLDKDGVPDVDDGQLRMLAHDVLQSVKEIPNTGNGFVVGGRAEQVTIEVFPERLSGYGISLDQVANTVRTANSEQKAGGVESGNTHFTVMTGAFLNTVEDITMLVVGTHNDIPVYLHDVARVTQGPEDAKQLVAYYTGTAGDHEQPASGVPAVTIAVAKKPGVNGVTVANAIIKRVNDLEGTRIPANVAVNITRDYGETANDKVNELIFKLFVATGFVFLLVLLAFRALRPAIVVVLVIPVVLLMTIFYAWVADYTIDRVSLFALIFSIGILVDDAIVVVENIYRRWLEEGKTDAVTAVDAVREVGNPTILATFTVIAALMPMGFVSGMMGPYMAPIPALGSAAMLISLFAAFVFTPWLAISRWLRPSMSYLLVAEKREHKEAEKMERFYRKILTPLIEHPRKRYLFRIVLWGSFFLACSMFYTNTVAVKILPLDNKPEFSVVLDMPEGTALPVTINLAHKIAENIRKMPEVTAIQVYAGTAKPYDFNGMVRHYYLRQDPWLAEIQVQLLHKSKRKRSSHEIAVETRKVLEPIIKASGAKYAVVEMPPGPPVLQSVVAEVHGPSAEIRRQVARDLTGIFSRAESLRDVDSYMRDDYEYWRFRVDTEKSVRRGISVDTINRNLSMALGGMVLGDVKQRAGHEPVNIVIQVPLAERSQVTRLGDLPIQSQSGITLPLRELGKFERMAEEEVIYHKDLRGIEYVVADVGGKLAAPIYGMFQVQDILAAEYTVLDGVKLDTFWLKPPPDDTVSSIEWTGEWTVTFETFRDMGGAFMVALVIIYILVVWEFGNFRIPALIMAPIPLTLIGIIPMHAIMGAEFSATSMIGWIALAGIIVRNSILLVDFSVHEIQRGIPVAEAVIRACKTRTRPIVITALALVCGSSVIYTDPIFQGMAISLSSGVLVSTILTLIVIPLGCIKSSKALCEVAGAGYDSGGTPMPEEEEVVEAPAATVYKTPIPLVIWGKVATVLMMLLYAVRGIFLLVSKLVSKPKVPPPVVSPAPVTASTPVVSEDKTVQQRKAAEVPVVAADVETVADLPSAATGKPVEENQLPKIEVTAEKPIDKSPEPVAEAAVIRKKSQAKARPVKKRVAKKNIAKKPPAPKKRPVKKAIKKSVPKSVAGKSVEPGKPKATTSGKSKPALRKGARRGIRLKLGDRNGME
ncbi:efflux RND transporter permease subunit [Candidatus Vondammii sp. HM_W22]|uniref:efflux RND transporter permease subunit n=1 Tax=Candidatus Vondammii sp. HM_W22 TaxID=2687299 RepID=UPI001F14717A|nr:efflux RND transporter permease subunit [Candidatus Vondammii sp. HM_W22]